MSVFNLQIIAMIAMFCDHLAIAIFENHIVLRLIGRFAFVIYAFLLAEGFRHFKDDRKRVVSHLCGYIFLVFISEPCYDFFINSDLKISTAMDKQSVMITLLIGFLCLIAINVWQGILFYQMAAVLFGASCSFLMIADYGVAGVLLICALYFYVSKFLEKSYTKRFFCILGILTIYLSFFHWERYNFCSFDMYVSEFNAPNLSLYAIHIIIAIYLADYKGELGFYSKKFKMFYRYFYPFHLFILGILRKF